MEFNFKVGDRVRIRQWEDMKREFGSKNGGISTKCTFVTEMNHLCGRTAEIKAIKDNGLVVLDDWSDCSGSQCWDFSTDMLEPVSDCAIHIYFRNNSGKIVFKHKGEAIKSGHVICEPAKSFRLEDCAKIALSTLFMEEKKTEKLYSGKAVCTKSCSEFFTKGKIYSFEDGKTVADTGEVLDSFEDFQTFQKCFQSDFIEIVE